MYIYIYIYNMIYYILYEAVSEWSNGIQKLGLFGFSRCGAGFSCRSRLKRACSEVVCAIQPASDCAFVGVATECYADNFVEFSRPRVQPLHAYRGLHPQTAIRACSPEVCFEAVGHAL